MLEICLYLEHTCVRDLGIEVTSRAGTKVTLIASVGSAGILFKWNPSNIIVESSLSLP